MISNESLIFISICKTKFLYLKRLVMQLGYMVPLEGFQTKAWLWANSAFDWWKQNKILLEEKLYLEKLVFISWVIQTNRWPYYIEVTPVLSLKMKGD